MSEAYDVPLEIQSEIIKRVDNVRSLIRFRSVSKRWKSLIDSSEFITHHHHSSSRRADPHYLLVIGYNVEDSGCNYVSIVDDDTFPRHKFSPVVAPAVKLLDHHYMLDCSHGLVYLHAIDSDRNHSIVIWNPSIGKSVSIMMPHGGFLVGVGVCPKTSDPKIVKITHSYSSSVSADWLEAEVFSLSSRAWRSISNNFHLPGSMAFDSNQVLMDGVIHWVAHDYQRNKPWDFIMSFDLVSEEFKEVALPHSLAHGELMTISKLNESLVVLQFGELGTYDAWMMMENGFVKLFSLGLYPNHGFDTYEIIGFRRNGQPIHPCGCDDGSLVSKLVVYEPSTNLSSDLGIYLPCDSDGTPRVEISSYTESLLLLNHHSDLINQA